MARKRDSLVIADHGVKYDFIDAGFNEPNKDAEVVIVGITPGITQVAQEESGWSSKERKRKYAFSGNGMRKNLYKMLECIGLKEFLGDFDEKTLWESPKFFDRIDATSLLKRGVFTRKEMTDSTSVKVGDLGSMFNNPLKIKGDAELEKEFKSFEDDLKQYRKVRLFIALGSRVKKCLDELGSAIRVPVVEIPHPSGANSGRIKAFLTKASCEPCLISDSTDDEPGKIKCYFRLAKDSRQKVLDIVNGMNADEAGI